MNWLRCQERPIQGQMLAVFGLTEEHLSVLQSKFRCLSLALPSRTFVFGPNVLIATKSQQIMAVLWYIVCWHGLMVHPSRGSNWSFGYKAHQLQMNNGLHKASYYEDISINFLVCFLFGKWMLHFSWKSVCILTK